MPSIAALRSSRPTAIDRFFAKVEKSEGCWLWTGAKNDLGYGKLVVCGQFLGAHRFSYLIHKGVIAKGLEIDHLCRNPSCVNPSHLEAVTHRENMLRGQTIAARHAVKTHCPQGHEYDFANTYVSVRGLRYCRACGRQRKAALRRLPNIEKD